MLDYCTRGQRPILASRFHFVFEREGRASNYQKQNTVTLQCGAEASSSSKRNKWRDSPWEDPVYAGFELEFAGAERYGVRKNSALAFPKMRFDKLDQLSKGKGLS